VVNFSFIIFIASAALVTGDSLMATLTEVKGWITLSALSHLGKPDIPITATLFYQTLFKYIWT